MDINRTAGFRCGSLVYGVLAVTLCWPADRLQAGVSVYRCTNDAGQIELRQTYCPAGDQQRLQVETSKIGWVRPKRSDNTRRKSKTKRATGSRKTGQKKPSDASEDAFQQRCWKAEKKLERVQRQLRQGYRPAQGEKLRQRRREQEQYLQRFCRR